MHINNVKVAFTSVKQIGWMVLLETKILFQQISMNNTWVYIFNILKER